MRINLFQGVEWCLKIIFTHNEPHCGEFISISLVIVVFIVIILFMSSLCSPLCPAITAPAFTTAAHEICHHNDGKHEQCHNAVAVERVDFNHEIALFMIKLTHTHTAPFHFFCFIALFFWRGLARSLGSFASSPSILQFSLPFVLKPELLIYQLVATVMGCSCKNNV